MKSSNSDRKYTIYAIIIIIGIIYLFRLFFIQVIDKNLKQSADNNVLKHITEYPARGLIYDRNNKLLVYNEAVYDLMIIPRQIKEMDTLQLCEILEITKDDFIKKYLKAKKYSRYKSSIFEKQISKETYGYLQEKLYKFSGFYVQARTLRKYPYKNAAHTLGYVGEVSRSTLKKDNYNKSGDYVGINGLEKSYEKELRGIKGNKIVMVDVFSRVKGSYMNKKYDKPARTGKSLQTSIDIELQAYGELLMRNKKGSIVAIQPETGEILAIISSPAYDPNLLVGRVRTKNYKLLKLDSTKPLFNRALMAQYPPGSTFKIANALIGLEEKAITSRTTFKCHQGFHMAGLKVGCHEHEPIMDLHKSIQHSCNAYYCHTFLGIFNQSKFDNTKEAFDNWRNHVISFGFGQKFNTDLPYELKGNIPKSSYYDRYYKKGRWKPLTVISLAIGQGEILATPLQLANFSATVANRGFYYPPHIIRSIGDSVNPNKIQKKQTTISPKYYESVVDGMREVVLRGTGRIAEIDSISVCGKTGTAQNPHGKDHSIFIAFAPKENTEIAISVFVENAGYGSTWAAPIASLMIEKYIKRKVERKQLEERMLKPIN